VAVVGGIAVVGTAADRRLSGVATDERERDLLTSWNEAAIAAAVAFALGHGGL
jgi:hypothetical protein